MFSKSFSISGPVRAADGSSRMRMAASSERVPAISTSCWWPTPKRAAGVSGSRLSRPTRVRAVRAVSRRVLRSRIPAFEGSRESEMFSATLRVGMMLSSCRTMETPAFSAAFREGGAKGLPLSSMCPDPAGVSPVRMRAKVDFPAPLLPIRAWTSPFSKTKSKSCSTGRA